MYRLYSSIDESPPITPAATPPASYHSVTKLPYSTAGFCGFLAISSGVSDTASVNMTLVSVTSTSLAFSRKYSRRVSARSVVSASASTGSAAHTMSSASSIETSFFIIICLL